MEKLILEETYLILDYVKKHHPLDEYFIFKYLTNSLNYFHLEDYLKRIYILKKESQTKDKSVAYIKLKEKELVVNLSHFYTHLKEFKQICNFKQIDLDYLDYILIGTFLTHELKHLLDWQLIHSLSSSLESKILKLVDTSYLLEQKNSSLNKIIYNKIDTNYYYLNPLEMNANSFSFTFSYDFLTTLNTNWGILPEFIEALYLQLILKGYEKNLYPTLFYTKKLGTSSLLASLPLSNLNLKERLKLGLQISKEEYNSLVKRHSLLLSRIRK